MESWHTLLCICLFVTLFGKVWTIGITTHIESGRRAQEFADVKSEGIDYGELVKTHEDAFQAGLPYVDSFWSTLCYGSAYYNVSQHSHWGPFIEAYIDYIRDTYPKPWDRWTEKLVVFLFGVMGHHATDVNWHGTDIDEGLVPTMGMVNFHGSFDDAHHDADVASDVITTMQNDMDYVGTVTKWYVPSEDLEEIYKVMYGEELITAGVIENCSQIVFLARLGEQLLPFEAIYPHYASRSPFVIDRLNNYFLGGVDDDAVWTQNLWYHTVTMLDHGTEVCEIPQNTLYITCNVTEDPDTGREFQADFLDDVHDENYMKWLIDTADLQQDDVIMERTERGVYFSVSDELQELLRLNMEFRHLLLDDTEDEVELELPSFYYDTDTPYSKIGETMLSGDMNNDGIDDLIITAPGHGSEGNSNQGRVYVVYGSEEGLPAANITLDQDADEILDGQELNGRFGSGVAVVDVNADSILDLAVSAPSVGSPDHQYKGEVYIYYGHGAGGLAPVPSVTISCTMRYCNFGWTLTSGDLNDDGFADLVIGSPFAPSGGEQRGFVGVFYADPDFHDRDITEEDLDWRFSGEQEYQHFGETLVAQKTSAGETWLMVGSPSYRICAREDCDFDEDDIQAAGKFDAFRSPLGDSPDITIDGDEDLAQMASALWTGNYKQTELLVISSVTRNLPEFADTLDDQFFNITRVTDNSTQFGWVAMYDMNNLSEDMEPVYTFWGEKPFSRFGANVEFIDATGDGVTDVIISGHLYSERWVEQPDQGRVYVFSGVSEEYERYADEADMILSLGEIKCQFGSSIVSFQTSDGVQLLVSAQHSDHNVRIGGRIALFDFPI